MNPVVQGRYSGSILVLVLLLGTCSAWAGSLRFERITVADGLPQSDVAAIAQDHSGYIWLGTQNGLARYDGHEFKVFQHEPDDPLSLSSNIITGLLVSSSGSLWVGTRHGLNRFDPLTGRAQRLAVVNDGFEWLSQNVDPLTEHSSGLLLVRIGTTPGILDPETALLKPIPFEVDHGRFDFFRHGLLVDSRGDFWVLTRQGLWLFDIQSEHMVQAWQPDWSTEPGLHGGQRLVEWTDGRLVLVADDGLRVFDPGSGQVTQHLRPSEFGFTSDRIDAAFADRHGSLWLALPNALVRVCPETGWWRKADLPLLAGDGGPRWELNAAELSDHEIWLATQAGVFRYVPRYQQFSAFQHDPTDPHSIVPTPLHGGYRLFADRDGTVWIGSRLGGLSRFSPQRNRFELVADWDVPSGAVQVGNNIVRAIVEHSLDRHEELWLGLEWGGIHRLRRNSGGTYQWVDHYDPVASKDRRLPDGHVHGLAVHPRSGEVWATTRRQIVAIDPASGQFRIVVSGDALPGNLSLFSLLINEQGDWLWAGSSTGAFGFRIIDDRELVLAHQPDSLGALSVMDLLEISDHLILVAGNAGLGLIDTRQQGREWLLSEPENYQSMPREYYGLAMAADGSIWSGGRQRGLTRIELQQDANGDWLAELEQFGREAGLVDDTIYAVLPDPDGRLWLSSNRGLMRWCPDSFYREHYTPRDGLQDHEFNNSVAHVGPSGRYYFGGIRGVNAFRPERVQAHPSPPTVLLQSLEINDRAVDANGMAAGGLRLGHNDNTLVIGYAGLHFADPSRNQFAYRLEGLEPDWIEAGTMREVRYPGLQPGQYRFWVRAANSDGIWSEPSLLAEFQISRPPWQTGWAYAGYATLAAGLIVLMLLSQIWRRRALEKTVTRRTAELAREKHTVASQARALEQSLEDRTALLANVSHELRTPLTLIRAGLNRLKENPDDPEALDLGERYIQRLDRLVDQLLDLSRVRADTFKPAKQPWSLDRHLRQFAQDYAPLAAERGIQLDLALEGRWNTVCNHDLVDKCLSNLLSNALKYTPSGGQVVLRLNGSAERAEIEVSDTGPGIPTDEQATIFERFQRRPALENQAEKGAGIGLALVQEAVLAMGGEIHLQSTPGNGSRFTLFIPARSIGELAPDDSKGIGSHDVQISESSATQSVRKEPEKRPTSPANRLGTILIVEDNRDLRRHLQGLLADQWRTVTATDGSQALARLAAHDIDIVLSDIMMPNMDGLELLQRIRDNLATSHIPFLILTARRDTETRMQGLKLAADTILTKPFNDEELRLTLANTVRAIESRHRHDRSGNGEDSAISPRDQIFIDQINAWLEAHHGDPATRINDLAQHLNLDERTLQRKTRALFGKPPKAVLTEYRLDRAAELLREIDRKVADVSAECGFSSTSYFGQQFAKCFGQAPSSWKKAKNGGKG